MINDEAATKITMQGVHLDLTEAMRSAIREKFSVLLRHNDRIIRINVRLHSDQQRSQQHNYHATGEIEIGGPNLVATTEGTEAYTVLDELVEKLDRLLGRRHGQLKDKRNHPHDVELESSLPKITPSPEGESAA
jgi:putative sigma-54 modulation protein